MSKTTQTTGERLVAVLRHDQRANAEPACFVSRTEAQYLLDCKFAFWRSRWTIILKKPLPLSLHGPSANISEGTMLAAITGSRYHRTLIEAWR